MTTSSFANNPLRNRAHIQQLARDLAAPLLPHFSSQHAQVRLGENRALYGDPAGWIEGFARPLWGLAPLAAGRGTFEHWHYWQRGIAAGTDPNSAEYWGLAGDFDQRSVEQAAFGAGLILAPEQLWTPLSREVQSRLATWLQHINTVRLVHSNWLFFRVLVNLGLKSCGEAFSSAQIEADLDRLEEFHIERGWYADGSPGPPYRDGRTGDYYVPMAFHYYALFSMRFIDDDARRQRFIARATDFAQDFQHYFAADGSGLPFGRSLTYRFAQGAFWGALAFANIEALPWGVMKGLYLRHLRWWLRQPIFSESGLLTIGYAYPNLVMAESYNSSASPYWALKTLLPLALPESHPFWRADELPLPPRPAVRTLRGANLILVTTRESRDVVAINPGQPVLDWPRHAAHKYSKCTYSTRFAFTVPTSVSTAAEGGLDGVLALSDDGRLFRAREQCVEGMVQEGVAFSKWTPWPDVTAESWIMAEGDGHLRIHRVNAGRRLTSLDASFAVPYVDRTKRALFAGEQGAEVRAPAGNSWIRDLSGGRKAACEELGANSHLLAPLAAMPCLRGEHAPGVLWLASWCGAQSDAAVDDHLAYAFVYASDEIRVTHLGEPWWSLAGGVCGTSSPQRLREHSRLV